MSDTARVDLGEDDWFEEYENNIDQALLRKLLQFLCMLMPCTQALQAVCPTETNESGYTRAIRLELQKVERTLVLWKPRLADMRRNATLYVRASSFCNKDILGPKFFKTQLDTLILMNFDFYLCYST